MTLLTRREFAQMFCSGKLLQRDDDSPLTATPWYRAKFGNGADDMFGFEVPEDTPNFSDVRMANLWDSPFNPGYLAFREYEIPKLPGYTVEISTHADNLVTNTDDFVVTVFGPAGYSNLYTGFLDECWSFLTDLQNWPGDTFDAMVYGLDAAKREAERKRREEEEAELEALKAEVDALTMTDNVIYGAF